MYTSALDAFYEWLNSLIELECLTEKEYYQIEREWWGMYYELACELA